MSKIKLTYKDKDYILEYTRTTARGIEERGFVASKVESSPNRMIPLLVYGAFKKNHPTLKETKIDEIFSAQTRKGDLIGKLAELYAETITSLLGDGEEADEKNATWEII